MFFSLFLLIYFSGYSLYRILSLSHITFGFCNLIPILHSLKSNSLNENRSKVKEMKFLNLTHLKKPKKEGKKQCFEYWYEWLEYGFDKFFFSHFFLVNHRKRHHCCHCPYIIIDICFTWFNFFFLVSYYTVWWKFLIIEDIFFYFFFNTFHIIFIIIGGKNHWHFTWIFSPSLSYGCMFGMDF